MRSLAAWVTALPRTTAAVLVGVAALVACAISLWPLMPLARRPGFAEAVASIGQPAPGTLVVVAPPADSAALAHLPAAWTASDAVPIEVEGRRRFVELVVISPVGEGTPPELAAAPLAARQRFGDVAVTRYRYPEAKRVLFDLRAALAEATVWLGEGATRRRCEERRGDAVACAGEPQWSRVGPASIRVEGSPWACVWAHPRRGLPLTIDLGERELGEALELAAAFDDGAVRGGGAPVQLVVEVDGVGAQRLVRTNARGLARTRLRTTPGERRGVRVVVSADDDARRHLCLELRLTMGAS